MCHVPYGTWKFQWLSSYNSLTCCPTRWAFWARSPSTMSLVATFTRGLASQVKKINAKFKQKNEFPFFYAKENSLKSIFTVQNKNLTFQKNKKKIKITFFYLFFFSFPFWYLKKELLWKPYRKPISLYTWHLNNPTLFLFRKAPSLKRILSINDFASNKTLRIEANPTHKDYFL